MAKKGNLFSLIKSLNKSEKRYFKNSAGQSAENKNYLKLFNAIEKMDEYDEKELKEKFKGEKFVKQLHVTKIYLTDLVLKTLRNYNSKKSINSQLINLISDAEILFDKELYDLCFYRLKKAEAIADEYDKFSLLLETLSLKRKLLRTTSGFSVADEEKIGEKEIDTIKKIDSLNKYYDLMLGFFDQSISSASYKDDDYFKNEKLASTLRQKILFYHMHYTFNLINSNSKEANKSISSLIEIIEKYPKRIKDDPSSYATALSNKISLLLMNKDWDEIPELINKVRSIPSNYNLNSKSRFAVRLWIRLFNIELEMYRDKKELGRGIVLIKEIQVFLEKHYKAVPDEYLLLFYYQFAYIFFLNKEYSTSLHWLNEIMNKNFGPLHEDVQSYARLLGLIIHFELRNIIVLRYAVNSCRRFLKKKKNLQEFESLLLRFFSRLSLANEDEYQNLFGNFYKILFNKKEQIVSDDVLDYIDFKSWLKENLEKQAAS